MSFLKQIQNKLFLIIGIVFFSISSIFGFSVDGENFEANFKISSWTASKDGSVITSEGIVGEGYGKVYLTHTFALIMPKDLQETLLAKLEP